MILKILDGHSLLLHGVAVPHSHCLVIEGVKVYDDTQGGADFVLSTIALTNIAIVIPHYIAEFILEKLVDLSSVLDQLWLIL